MKQAVISNIDDIKKTLEENNYKIFGLGGFCSTRSEIAGFVKDCEIFFINKTGEYESVKRNIKLRQFIKKYPDKPYFVKKPEKILIDEEAQKMINLDAQKHKIGIYVYLTTTRTLEICNENNWKLIGNSIDIYKKVDDRGEFYKILEKIKYQRPETVSLDLDNLEKNIDGLYEKFGDNFVIQLVDEGGGRGTFIINGEEDKDKIIGNINQRIKDINRTDEKHRVIVSKFVKGPIMSINGCITKDNGILSSYAQYQLIDIEESVIGKTDAKGVFCGHDWSLSNEISQIIHDEAGLLIEKIGNELKKYGALGMFGLDFIWDEEEEKIFPLEINPRLMGSFPTTVYVQMEKGEVPLVAFHILDFLGISYKIKNREVYKKDSQRQGSHLLLFNPTGHDIICTKGLEGGVYALEKDEIVFQRLGTSSADIKNKNEFILTDGVPVEGNVFKKNGKITRIMAKEAISTKQGRELNDWAKAVVGGFYKKIKFEKYAKN